MIPPHISLHTTDNKPLWIKENQVKNCPHHEVSSLIYLPVVWGQIAKLLTYWKKKNSEQREIAVAACFELCSKIEVTGTVEYHVLKNSGHWGICRCKIITISFKVLENWYENLKDDQYKGRLMENPKLSSLNAGADFHSPVIIAQ